MVVDDDDGGYFCVFSIIRRLKFTNRTQITLSDG